MIGKETIPPPMLSPSTIKKCVAELGTPLIVVDHNSVRAAFKEFVRNFPDAVVFYAVKCLNDIKVIETLYKAGAGFYVSSLYEIALIEQLVKGLPEKEKMEYMKNKVCYANPVKEVESLKVASKYGLVTAYDCEEEIAKIKKYAPNLSLFLRVKAISVPVGINCQSKYGCSRSEAVKLIKLAVDQGFTVEGLTFTVGSQHEVVKDWILSIKAIKEIYDEAQKCGILMKKLNISGGFPVQLESTPLAPSLAEIAAEVNPLLKELFPTTQIYAEPGRYITAMAGTLVAEVFGKKTYEGTKYIFINESVFGSFRGLVTIEPQVMLRAVDKFGPLQKTIVCGRMADTADIIGEFMLPELEMGDLIYADGFGAYTHCYSSSYGSLPTTPTYHLNI
jgi:ornithine decarboxylase